MIDTQVATEVVELNATSPNELIGEHTVYKPYGTFVFVNGKLEVTVEHAENLRKAGIVL